MAGNVRLNRPPQRGPEVLQDFSFRSLQFRDFLNLSEESKEATKTLFQEAHDIIPANVRCVTDEENEKRSLGLPEEDLCTYNAEGQGIPNQLLTIFIVGRQAGGQGIGTFKLTDIEIKCECPTKIEIACAPSPGFGGPGTEVWGEFGTPQWSNHTIDFMRFFLDNALPLESGKSLQVVEWHLPLKAEINGPGAVVVERNGIATARGLDEHGRNRLKITKSP